MPDPADLIAEIVTIDPADSAFADQYNELVRAMMQASDGCRERSSVRHFSDDGCSRSDRQAMRTVGLAEADLQVFAQRSCGHLDLVEPRGMIDAEQAVDLR